MKTLILTCSLMGAIFYQMNKSEFVYYSDNPSVSSQPLQKTSFTKEFDFKGYKIKPLADFKIEARVLSRRYYSNDKQSDICPIDLALGWGPMSKSSTLKHFDISQRGRWYFWESSDMPISQKDVETNSSNMHIIPANNKVAEKLNSIKNGHIIKMYGHLVECREDNWKWRSSTSRNDTGNGACEIVFVKDLSIRPVK